jgi:hypothetical protein
LSLGLREQLSEAAVFHGVADALGVLGVVVEVGVGVEGDAWSGVAEDAADVGDVEFEVDDEVACVGVAEVVDTQRRLVRNVESGLLCCCSEASAFGVAVVDRCARRGGEDVVAVCAVSAGEFVFGEPYRVSRRLFWLVSSFY